MKNNDFILDETKSKQFNELVKKAKRGDKNSMEEILALFEDEIIHLSQFITLPKEESIQILKEELIKIVLDYK